MNTHILNRNLLFNTLWSFLGRSGYIIIALMTNIILARLLTPKEFGQVSIIMFFIVVSSILVESGLAGALVRKNDVTEVDYSTVFIFNLAISITLMLGLLISAKYIANYYNDLSLKNLLRFSSLILIFNALRITQSVKLIKSLKFKLLSIYELLAVIVGSVIAIYFAKNGAGAISLIILQLSNAFTLTIILWIFVGPITTYKFSRKSFQQVYKFGINTTLASIIDKIFDNCYQLILGKYFSINQSGYFYQAKKLQELPVGIVQSGVLGVVYATLSKLQSNNLLFNQLYFNIVRIFTVTVALICMLLFYYSNFAIALLYGEKWMPSAEYLQLLTISAFFYLQEIFNRILFKIFDRTDLILKLEVIKKGILIVTIIYGVFTHSISNLLYGFITVSIISFIINYHFARKIHSIPYWNELNIILKVILSCILTTYFTFSIEDLYNIKGAYTLFLLPVILITFFAILTLFKAIDFSKDYNSLKKLIKQDL